MIINFDYKQLKVFFIQFHRSDNLRKNPFPITEFHNTIRPSFMLYYLTRTESFL